MVQAGGAEMNSYLRRGSAVHLDNRHPTLTLRGRNLIYFLCPERVGFASQATVKLLYGKYNTEVYGR